MSSSQDHQLGLSKKFRRNQNDSYIRKIVIIMGASSGIGEATAKLLASKGAKLVLAARREERIKNLAKDLGQNVFYQEADVANRQQVKSVIDLAIEKFGRIDVMYNNAGIMPQGNLSKLEYDS